MEFTPINKLSSVNTTDHHFITISEELLPRLMDERLVKDDTNYLEQKYQAKILDFLASHGFEADKVVLASKAGLSDTIAVSKVGQAWYIEVKRPRGELAPLQRAKLVARYNNKAVVICAYGYKDFLKKYELLTANKD